jgi:hypothetical protein
MKHLLEIQNTAHSTQVSNYFLSNNPRKTILGLESISDSALNPAVQIDHPKNNEIMKRADCLPALARRARRLNGRSAENIFLICEICVIFSRVSKVSDKQHANYGPIVTDHDFAGGLWTTGVRALPETVSTRVLRSGSLPTRH